MDINILALETSCDETSASVVKNGSQILSNLVSSQTNLHQKYGGVVPEIASRQHLEVINPIIDEALQKAQIEPKEICALAVSYGPGLVGALLVGVSTANALSYVWGVPLIPVNHLEGHLYANYLTGNKILHPYVGLITSGGHTDLLFSPREGELHLMGATRDDAAGEAFDKIARKLNLGYPGGPVIDKLAQKGNPQGIKLPRASLKKQGGFDFSFSGLKTAVLNFLHQQENLGADIPLEDLVASFQQAVVDMLVEQTIKAVKEKKPASLLLAGGVAANSALRAQMKSQLAEAAPTVDFHCPPPNLCTDNAAMLGAAAYPLYQQGVSASLQLNAVPHLEVGTRPDS